MPRLTKATEPAKFQIRPRSELLDILASGNPPAFATDAEERIIFWNRGAESIFKKTADEVLGAHCYDVIGGRDVYGNRFCYRDCPVVATLQRGEQVRGYELAVASDPDRTESLNVTILQIPGSRPDAFAVVHILQRIDSDGRVARAIESAPKPTHEVSPLAALNPPVHAPPPLTEREKEILRWVAAGLQNKEIAKKLHISLATVRNHVRNILEKLTVHSKLEAVALAFRNGWVAEGDSM